MIKIKFKSIFLITLSLIMGSWITKDVLAMAASSIIKNTDTHFNQGTLSSTAVSGSGSGAVVQLSGTAGPDGTQYKRAITITNTSGSTLTDYQVSITLDTASLITAGKLQANCPDIRFRDSDDSTAIANYWVENCGAGGSATTKIWVKVPSISSSGTTIYLYYGSASATTQSSITNTFIREINGVRGAWSLDEASNSNASDTSGNNNTGTSTGTGVVTGKYGNARNFNGSANIVISGDPSSLKITGDATIMFWAYPTSFSTARRNPFCKAYGGEFCMTMEPSSTINLFYGGAGSNTNPYIYSTWPSGTLVNNQWLHFAWTKDTSTSTAIGYKNGTATVTGSCAPYCTTVTSNMNLYFGTGYAGGYIGNLDHIRVYNTVLTPSEISDLYNNYGYITDNYPGKELVKKYTYVSGQTTGAEGVSTSAGTESIALDASGSWESPTDSNVIDTIWNGGWGDGTDGSTAFSATVANVGTNNTIIFAMRTATTANGLSAATYQTLGTANSGTTFTATKAQLDALGLATGTSRYVQVKATFAQTSGTNPQLDDFTINYLSDNTAPGTNATNIAMTKTNGGATITSNGWTNDLSPYFSWTAGADSQAGLKGYCLYLGTSSTGDPSSDKGLLGTSPVSTTGSTCQFIVSAVNIDFATTSYRGSTWLTSSSSSYYLNVKAIDNNYNVYASNTQFRFNFDSASPSNPNYISLPSDFIATKSATLTWPTTGDNAPADTQSGVAGLQYRIGSSGTWYGDSHTGTQDSTDLLTNDGSYTTDVTNDYPVISEGNNTIYIRVYDTAGNYTSTYVTGVLKVNTTAPSAPQSLAVTPSDATTNSYSFSWSAPSTYQGTVGNITYCYTVNTTPTASTCTFTAAGVTSLSADSFATQPGTNTLYLVAKDEAANINYETYTSVTFTYSGTAPGIPGNVDIADISTKSTSNWKLAISWDTPTDVGAGVSTYNVYRSTTATTCSDSFSSFTYIGSTAGTSYSDSGLTQQYYYYCLKACDSANSCSASSSTVNAYPDGKYTSASSLSSGPTTSSITTKKAVVTWSTDRTSDSKIQYGTSSGNYFSSEVSNSTQVTSHSITLTNLSPGTTYYYKAKWTDEDGNTGTSGEKTFVTDAAPFVSSVKFSNLNINSVYVTFIIKNATKAILQYGKTTSYGASESLSTSTSESTYSVALNNLTEGTIYHLRIVAEDDESNTYNSDDYTFETLPTPKILNLKLQQVSGMATATLRLLWTSNTLISSIVTYYPTASPERAIDSISLALKKNHEVILKNLNDDTDYTLIIKGKDSAGNESQVETKKVKTSNDMRAPEIQNMDVESTIIGVGDTAKAQIVVSWDTDEPASTQVEYAQGTGTSYDQTTQEDSNLTTNHTVTITSLTPAKIYHLRASSKDKSGNIGQSFDTVIITPKSTKDALNLVIENLSTTFGFLNNLNIAK